MKKLPLLALLAAWVVVGCGSADTKVSATDENTYRNPQRTMPADAPKGAPAPSHP